MHDWENVTSSVNIEQQICTDNGIIQEIGKRMEWNLGGPEY